MAKEPGRMQERHDGELRPLSEADLDSILLVHRFAVVQEHAGRKKLRVIDNFKSNEVNDHGIA